MYKLDLPQDPKEVMAIQARRARESERLTRIMNPRERTMGRDEGALAQQAQDHTIAKHTYKIAQDMYGDQMNRQDRILQLLTRRAAEDARTLNHAEIEYRTQYQAKEQTREFDLNDPNALKNEAPLPGPDDVIDDARLGVSSMQYFEGEDSAGGGRVGLQKQQIREWTKDAIAEHQAIAAAALHEKQLTDSVVAQQTALTGSLMDQQAQARQDAMYAHKAELAAQVAQTKEEKAAAEAAEQRQDYVDVMSTFQSDLLQDAPESGYDERGNIKHATAFRGFTSDHLSAIRAEQASQEVEMAQRKAAEQQEFDAYAAQEQTAARMAHLAERAEQRARKGIKTDTVQDNLFLTTQRATPNYKNQVSEGFFGQFGTSSR